MMVQMAPVREITMVRCMLRFCKSKAHEVCWGNSYVIELNNLNVLTYETVLYIYWIFN